MARRFSDNARRLGASAEIQEPIDRADHEASPTKIADSRNDDIMERAAYGQFRIGRRARVQLRPRTPARPTT